MKALVGPGLSCSSWSLALFAALTVLATPVPAQSDRQEELRTAARSVFEDLDVAPGLAVAVVSADAVLFSEGFGYADVEAGRPVTPDTIFYIASTTKVFTGLVAASLHTEGRIDLDRSLGSYLPEARFATGIDPESVSIRDLLTHTHGIENRGPVTFRFAFSGEYTDGELLELLQYHPPAPTGKAFRYGNIGYNLAGLVIEEVTSLDWKAEVAARLLKPLGMQSTSAIVTTAPKERMAAAYRLLPIGYERIELNKGDPSMHAAGGLLSTLSDMSRLLQAILNRGRLNEQQVFSEAALAEATKPWVARSGSAGEVDITGYGLGWNVGTFGGETSLHAFGSFPGFQSHLSLLPEQGIGVIVLANTALGGLAANVIALRAYGIFGALPDEPGRVEDVIAKAEDRATALRLRVAEDRARRAGRVQLLPEPFAAYVGTYENPLLGRIGIEAEGGGLAARMGVSRSAVEIYDGSAHAIRVELAGGGEVIRFRFADRKELSTALTYRDLDFRRIR